MHLTQLIPRLVVALISLLLACPVPAYELRGNVPAPEFPIGLPWLNVEKAVRMSDLRGKVVILDFWTYGCINCIHVIEDLKRLEEKYRHHLVVIGVHTPKFDNEKNLETLRRVLVRYNRVHPVIHDTGFELMKRYGARAWPTLFVVDPEGGVVGKVTGEGHHRLMDRVVGDLIEAYANELNDDPLPLLSEKEKLTGSELAFPGKIAVSDSMVAISDTLHHRIVITDHAGKVQRVIGGLEPGMIDGVATAARFSSPQGLAFGKKHLYVADTGNHAIRVIDLVSGGVETVAGTGKMGRGETGGPLATRVDLRSPWDVALAGDTLYIAMAGDHQIWRLDLSSREIGVFAGSGHEGIRDGDRHQATFSQPSGLSLHGEWLYVADAESSAVRRVNIAEDRVETLVGTGLHDFGDRDGDFERAQLQHPLGVATLPNGDVMIADTYNHKMKRLNLEPGSVQTVVGTGEPGSGSGTVEVMLNEPGGLAVFGRQVLIVDTNNHRILSFDMDRAETRNWRVKH